jgi:integrase/recombinase XerD
LASEEYIKRDPTTKLKTPKDEYRLPKALSIEELEMLREACESARQRAYLEVLYATGCRLSEVYQSTE